MTTLRTGLVFSILRQRMQRSYATTMMLRRIVDSSTWPGDISFAEWYHFNYIDTDQGLLDSILCVLARSTTSKSSSVRLISPVALRKRITEQLPRKRFPKDRQAGDSDTISGFWASSLVPSQYLYAWNLCPLPQKRPRIHRETRPRGLSKENQFCGRLGYHLFLGCFTLVAIHPTRD